MSFNAEDILKFKRYCQEICFKPLPLSAQACQRQGTYLWCLDWEMIELLKCLFNGSGAYLGDPPPRRLRNNPLWSKDTIISKVYTLIAEYKTAEKIIEYLREVRNGGAQGKPGNL